MRDRSIQDPQISVYVSLIEIGRWVISFSTNLVHLGLAPIWTQCKTGLVLLLLLNPIKSIVAIWKEVPTLPVLNNVAEPTYMFAATISAVRIGALLLLSSTTVIVHFFPPLSILGTRSCR